MTSPSKTSSKSFRFCHVCRKSKCNGRCEHFMSTVLGDDPLFVSKTMSYVPKQFKLRHFRNQCKSIGQDAPTKKLMQIYSAVVKVKKLKDSNKKGKHTKTQLNNQHHDQDIYQVPKAKVVKRVIECPICLTVKGKYKTLGCNHSICESCHSSILETTSLNDNCPICRKAMYVDNFKSYLIYKKHMGLSGSYTLVNLDVTLDPSQEEYLDEDD